MIQKDMNHLFEPLTLGNLELKNRLVVAPMVTDYCDQDGMATDRYIEYHRAKAKGGWAAIITEDYAVSPTARGFWTAGLWRDEQIESHKKLVEAIHAEDCKVIAQIYHAGRQGNEAVIGESVVSASPLPCPAMGSMPHELTVSEIKTIVSQFGDTALRAKKTGFDGVEIHGAHGYLIAQFMSNYSNKRTDGYGGHLMNRLRFPHEIIADIREKCGPDFFVGFRISADEQVRGGRTIEETKAICQKLEEWGVDALHISAGTYESVWAIIPPMNVVKGWIADLAEEVKKVVGLPVMTVGRITDPYVAESILASGKADLIAMGRPSLADPELPKKAEEGRYDDIRQCIGCQQGCLEILFGNQPIRCLVNPSLGYEYLNELKETDKIKRVTVVGAGPAGLEAARAAAEAGHQVTLYEKSSKIGGNFAKAAIPPFKGDLTLYISWLGHQMEKLGVELKLDTAYSLECFEEEKPDTVVLASGACPSMPDIEGLEEAHVLAAQDVLTGKHVTGIRVVIAGGGLVGSETALYLASMGRQVTIVEMLSDLALDEEATRRAFLMQALCETGVKSYLNAKCVAFKDGSVTIEADGNKVELEADSVVVALGYTPEQSLAGQLEGKVELRLVGDACEARDALEASREGFLAGTEL